jgi:hypothetical protein
MVCDISKTTALFGYHCVFKKTQAMIPNAGSMYLGSRQKVENSDKKVFSARESNRKYFVTFYF